MVSNSCLSASAPNQQYHPLDAYALLEVVNPTDAKSHYFSA